MAMQEFTKDPGGAKSEPNPQTELVTPRPMQTFLVTLGKEVIFHTTDCDAVWKFMRDRTDGAIISVIIRPEDTAGHDVYIACAEDTEPFHAFRRIETRRWWKAMNEMRRRMGWGEVGGHTKHRMFFEAEFGDVTGLPELEGGAE